MAEQLLSTDPQAGRLLSTDPGAGAVVPDFTTTNEPPSAALKAAAVGKNALTAALDALPGIGAIVGGAVATPETLGSGTVLGGALGAGAGRGLRDLIAGGLGLEPPTTVMGKAGHIAMDTAETYVAGKVLPALWEAIKAPGATVGDVIDRTKTLYKVLPSHLKGFLPNLEALDKLPKGVAKAPAAILERPAWQTWQQHLPEAVPSPQVARTTGTSMIPAAVPTPAPPTPTSAPPIATAPAPMPAPSPIAAPAAAASAMPNQIAINQLGLAARRAKLSLSLEEIKALVPLVEQGATPDQAVGALVAVRTAANPAAAFNARFGSMSDADRVADIAARVGNRSPRR